MQKVNVDVYIWNELRSNDRFGLNTQHVGIVDIVVFVGYRKKRQKRHFTHMSFSFILACGIIIETRPTEDISQRRTKQLSLE